MRISAYNLRVYGRLSFLFIRSAGKICEVNYACDTKCPKSIIDEIDLATCKIAESSAQSAC